MEGQLPYKFVVLFIACGTLRDRKLYLRASVFTELPQEVSEEVFMIVFVFAKRQITRFALKSNRAPHTAIGAKAPKSLRTEIERRLKRVAAISYEPTLLSENISCNPEFETYHFYYRMKSVDSLKQLDDTLVELYPGVKRRAGEPLRGFLLEQRLKENGCFCGVDTGTVDKLADLYEHARHDPAEFTKEHHQELLDLIQELIQHVKKRHSMKNETTHKDEKDTKTTTKFVMKSSQAETEAEKPTSLALAGVTTAAVAAELLNDKGQGQEDVTKVTYRPAPAEDLDSGTLLLTARHSGSSVDSQADCNLLIAESPTKNNKDTESYV